MPATSKLSSSNFLRQFRNAESRELNKLSAVQFMEVWDHYDNDGKEHFIERWEQFMKSWVHYDNDDKEHFMDVWEVQYS